MEKIRAVLKNLSGQDQAGADPGVTFLELGFDSLFLTQVAGTFRKEFGVKVTFRQLLEDLATMDALSTHLDAILPPDVLPPSAVSIPAPAPPCRPAPTGELAVTRRGVRSEQLTPWRERCRRAGHPGAVARHGATTRNAARRRARACRCTGGGQAARPGSGDPRKHRARQGRTEGVRPLPAHREKRERRIHGAAAATPRRPDRALHRPDAEGPSG